MPLYEYQCETCGERFEVIQKFSDPSPDVCTKCGKGPVVRLMSSPAIQFKGTGWYITDYARKGTSEGKDGKSAPAKEPGDSKESKPAAKSTDSSTTDSSASSGTSASKPTNST